MKLNVIIAHAACRSCIIFSDAKLVRAAARQGHATVAFENSPALRVVIFKQALPTGRLTPPTFTAP